MRRNCVCMGFLTVFLGVKINPPQAFTARKKGLLRCQGDAGKQKVTNGADMVADFILALLDGDPK